MYIKSSPLHSFSSYFAYIIKPINIIQIIHLYPPSLDHIKSYTFTPKNSFAMKFTVSSACKLALFSLITTQPAITLAVSLGVAAKFGAIAGTTITSSGNTVITGDCGTCPGISITGFPPGVCTGTKSAGGTLACAAEAACLLAYNSVIIPSALPSVTPLPSSDLGGVTLPPGIYSFPASAATLSGTFTADGTANPDGQWIFPVDSTFTTAFGSKVVLINGAQACNIYIVSGSSITIAAGSKLQCNFLAYSSISVGSGASNNGTLCALNGGISLIDDALRALPTCAT
jgi:hypothetical protein